jgi:hypothetical protein
MTDGMQWFLLAWIVFAILLIALGLWIDRRNSQ